MRTVLVLAATLAAVTLPGQALAQQDYSDQDLGSHIVKPDGPPPRKPLHRSDLDEAVTEVFRDADTNRDGLITLAEFNALIDSRRNSAIRSRFASIDSNNDDSVSLAEFAQWQNGLGSVALSDSAAAAAGGGLIAEYLPLDIGRNKHADELASVMTPLSATVIVEANTDYDAGVSLAELIAYEGKAFEAADTSGDGWLTADEMFELRRKSTT